jgi:hypothetical protein
MPAKNQNFEDAEQSALFTWARMESHPALPPGKFIDDFLFAIPNGGKRNIREAARFKAQGVKKGVSDVFLPVTIYKDDETFGGVGETVGFGLWIEMKKQRQHFRSMREAETSVSDHQQRWGKAMEGQGYVFKVCYGWEEARTVILEYLGQ